MATSALWIAAIFVPYPGKIGLLVAANGVEHPVGIFLASPASDRLLSGGWHRYFDIDHYVESVEGFFVIILGEGVFRLIEGSPSGPAITHKSGTVLTALLTYYLLHWLYFNGDHSKEFVHALRRAWWRGFLWKFFHVVLFAALFVMAASVLFLVEHSYTTPSSRSMKRETSIEGDSSGSESEASDIYYSQYALWSASSSCAIVIFAMMGIALLNRPLDKPKTLVVNSRWIRLVPRFPAIVSLAACH